MYEYWSRKNEYEEGNSYIWCRELWNSIISFFEKVQCANIMFLQNKIDRQVLYEGIPVYALREFACDRDNLIILLAVADKNVRRSAKVILEVKGVRGSNILDCTHFIKANCLDEDKERFCLICGQRVKVFLPAGEDIELFKRQHIIGGGRRNHALCSNCGCLERNRWCMYVLAQRTNVIIEPCTVLHFAPEEGIADLIRTNKECIYYSADLMRDRAMLQVDLTNILFKDSTFDYIIVNHVLEHILDERTAIRELKRVLKDDGVIIMSFPVCTEQDTYEDASIITRKDRKRNFGQEDHVRLYGRDYRERLESYGLAIEVKTPIHELTSLEIEKYGIIRDDIILLCTKDG